MAKIIVHTPTTTTLSAAPTSATAGTAVNLTATVAEVGGSSVPTGTVTFKDGTTTLGSMTLNATAIAVYTTSTLSVGSHSITAAYGGDGGNGASTSTAASVTVTAAAAPAVTIGVAPTSIVLGQSATLTWSSMNATACTASNAWTGTEAVSGTQTVTPSAAGTLSYVLTCTGTGGSANWHGHVDGDQSLADGHHRGCADFNHCRPERQTDLVLDQHHCLHRLQCLDRIGSGQRYADCHTHGCRIAKLCAHLHRCRRQCECDRRPDGDCRGTDSHHCGGTYFYHCGSERNAHLVID